MSLFAFDGCLNNNFEQQERAIKKRCSENKIA